MPFSIASGGLNRATSVSALVEESARGESQCRVLCSELEDVEAQVTHLVNALQRLQQIMKLDGIAAQHNTEQWQAEVLAERTASDRLQLEVRTQQEEHAILAHRLMVSQRINLEWQRRVRAISSELEETSNGWQEQLKMADSKWREMVDALRRKLHSAESEVSEKAKRLEDVKLENERLAAQLRNLHDREEAARSASSKWEALERELLTKAREADELKELLSASRCESASLSSVIDERSDELSRVQLDLHEARSRIEVLESQDQQEQSRTELLEHAHNALRAVEARCESLVSEVANAEWLSEDSASSLERMRSLYLTTNELKESLCTEVQNLRQELCGCQEQLSTAQQMLNEMTEAHDASITKFETNKEQVNQVWEEAMRSALAEKEAQLTNAIEHGNAAERLAQANATALGSVSFDTAARLRSSCDALQLSEAAVAMLRSTNAALEQRAKEAEAKLQIVNKRARNAEESTHVCMQMEAALAQSRVEVRSLQDKIRLMVEDRTRSQALQNVDAENEGISRDGLASLQERYVQTEAHGMQLDAYVLRESKQHVQAETKGNRTAVKGKEHAPARVATSVLLSIAEEARTPSSPPPYSSSEVVATLVQMLEQRERLEALQGEIRTARQGEMREKPAIESRAPSLPMQCPPFFEAGGVGEGLLETLGIVNRTTCLGGERLHKRTAERQALTDCFIKVGHVQDAAIWPGGQGRVSSYGEGKEEAGQSATVAAQTGTTTDAEDLVNREGREEEESMPFNSSNWGLTVRPWHWQAQPVQAALRP